MKTGFGKVLDFYLYSNLHIGLCALMFCLEYVHLSDLTISDPYFWLIGCSTVFLYTVHRYIGYYRVIEHHDLNERYQKIKPLIQIYPWWLVVFGLLVVYLALQTSYSVLLIIALPSLISACYVLPIFGNGRRLRDLPYIKIFLIAITWTWFATWYLIDTLDSSTYLLIACEQMCFMLGITLPFDIRDIGIDSKDSVQTLATKYGFDKTKKLAISFLGLSMLCLILLVFSDQISDQWTVILPYGILYLLTAMIMIRRDTYKKDVLITGLLDASILIKGVLGLLLVG